MVASRAWTGSSAVVVWSSAVGVMVGVVVDEVSLSRACSLVRVPVLASFTLVPFW